MLGLVACETDRAQRLADAAPNLLGRHLQVLEREGDFVGHRGRRDLRVRILEHHADMVGEPAGRRLDRVEIGDMDCAEELAAEELWHDAIHGEAKRGLAGTGRADDSDDLAPLDREVDIGEGHPFAGRIAIAHRSRSE